MKTSPETITILKDNEVFVFGSNMKGNHIGGAAKQALQWGAKMGKEFGHYGQTFAIPTMGLPLTGIKNYVHHFIDIAYGNDDLDYLVTEVGCGIAGYWPEEIAPMFIRAKGVDNIYLPKRFVNILKDMEAYNIVCRETGDVITRCMHKDEAYNYLLIFEDQDKVNGDFVKIFTKY